MAIQDNIMFDQTTKSVRHIVSKDARNYIYAYGDKDLSLDVILGNENKVHYYSSIVSLVTDVFQKRLKFYFSRVELHNFQIAISSAYKDILDIANSLTEKAAGMITRADYCTKCNKDFKNDKKK